MWVEQAIYGELQGGHALRHTSGDRLFALSIASRLDLPDNAPPGVAWSPYVSGFPSGDRYVLARTFEDVCAPRSGMVFTHALIMPIAEIIHFSSITSLFERLLTSIDKNSVLASINLVDEVSQAANAPELISAANELGSRGPFPVVRLGTENFEVLVSSIWKNLWPEIRANFGFRLSFGPSDVVENPAPILVCTPTALSARWSRNRVLNSNIIAPTSISASLLAGVSDRDPLLRFAHEIGADLRQFSQLPFLERIYTLLSGATGFDNILAAVRLIDKLSPDPSVGKIGKQEVMASLITHIPSATPSQILAMRNLELSGFPTPINVWQEIEKWLATRQFNHADDSSMVQIAVSAGQRDTAVDTWRNAIKRGVILAADIEPSKLAEAIWRWTCVQPESLSYFFELLPSKRSTELLIASKTPLQLVPSTAAALLQLCLTRKWLAMHGAVLSALENPSAAIQRQISVDTNLSDTAGTEFALRSASPTQLLECAVQYGEELLIALAVDAVIADPNIFANSHCLTVAEQKIWDIALRRNNSLWQAPRDPFAIRDAILQTLVDGGNVHNPLIEALSQTPLADLCGFFAREQLWITLKIDVCSVYLRATATSWLKQAVAGNIPFTPDPTLKAAILSSTDLNMRLIDHKTEVAAAIRIIEILESFDEQSFITWFRHILSRYGAIPLGSMEILGRLVLMRSWHQVVDEMLTRYRDYRRHDLKQALTTCASMISTFTRWKLNLTEPTVAEKWTWFTDVATKLYPQGPNQEELWARAGGLNSDLPINSSGKAMWFTVTNQMRYGRGPTPTRLLHEMQKDYKKNEELSFLANDQDIVGYNR